MPEIVLIAAYSQNRVIGRDNAMPWHLPGDLAHFKRETLGKPIIMGRKTWESLGRPLPGRRNLVISHDARFSANGAEVVTSIEAALQAVEGLPQAYVIGGGVVFRLMLPLAHRIVATEIREQVEGDTWFPELDSHWEESERSESFRENEYAYEFVTYVRR